MVYGEFNPYPLLWVAVIQDDDEKAGNIIWQEIALLYELYAEQLEDHDYQQFMDAWLFSSKALRSVRPDNTPLWLYAQYSTMASNITNNLARRTAKNRGFSLRYVAVLDMRTTQICLKLHGTIFHPDDTRLNYLTPPNHYNCRSRLIPVKVPAVPFPSANKRWVKRYARLHHLHVDEHFLTHARNPLDLFIPYPVVRKYPQLKPIRQKLVIPDFIKKEFSNG